jgi:alginate O-acetyltransferase complex protein AlgI
MLFNSFEFLFVFLPGTLICVYGTARLASPRFVIAVLIVASLIFYAASSLSYLAMFIALLLITYVCGAGTLASKNLPMKRAMLTVGCTINLGVLIYFKYRIFAASILNDTFGFRFTLETLILPLGISFFVFQKIAFLADVYNGRIQRIDFLGYVLFVAFFPQLIAGPIVHYGDMQPQFDRAPWRSISALDVAYAISFITFGLFKKLALADSAAPLANALFDSAAAGSIPATVDAWIGCLAFGLQIYWDFSAYSDIAVGLAALFGIRLPFNFDSPYKSVGIIEFWRRWHITLSRFLRDYLYIPLGGNQRGLTRRYLNLMITMALGGLWHGAAWTFIIWGAVHGILLSINHLWRSACEATPTLARLDAVPGIRAIYWAATFVALHLAWCFFRAQSLAAAVSVAGAMIGIRTGPSSTFDNQGAMLIGAGVAWTVLLPNTQELVKRMMALPPALLGVIGAAEGALLVSALCFMMVHQYEKFIYFMF